MKLKIYLILFMAHICLLHSSCSQNKSKGIVQNKNIVVLKSHAERDWKEIDSLKGYFCDYPEECERYEDGTFLEQRRFEDKVSKNRLRLAEAFLDSYPEDSRYYDVLKFYFHYFFEPIFVSEKIPDSLTTLLSKDYGKELSLVFLQQKRALPIDKLARERWLKKGNELVTIFLKSKTSLQRKAEIEIRLLGRDFRMALLQYQSMDMQKEGVEADFWERFDMHYWESFRLRAYNLLNKYSDLETMGSFVQQFVSLITKFSPALTESYWMGFFEMTGDSNPLADRKGFRVVHKMAKENLMALKSFDDSKPLDMAFTAMDGTKIDLANMRGKVVLIDFWSIRCGPCIKEMPHVMALYDKYRSQGFEVIGIVANDDTATERILEITKKQNATWPQYLDKGKNAMVSYHSLYNITSFPTVWLLNKEGEVVDKHARGIRLEPLIRKHLGLDK